MTSKKKALVAGAGGFIGHHLVKYLKTKGYWVRGADIKQPEFEVSMADEFFLLDLRNKKNALKATDGMEEVFNVAANMGGVGYIQSVHAQLMVDNILIDTNMLESSYRNGVKKFFYPSSALVYPNFTKESKKNASLKEEYAYPAQPDSEYGWEKLFIERLCASYLKDYGFQVRVARFHNVYGPLGVFQGGRERSIAALCRKIAVARHGDAIEVWGDGKQTRSYCYVNDCVEGVYLLMRSDVSDPMNIGSDRLVSINELIDIIAHIAGKKIKKRYDLSKPRGVRGRNSDNTKIKKLLRWEPSTPLEEGLTETYTWIEGQIKDKKVSL